MKTIRIFSMRREESKIICRKDVFSSVLAPMRKSLVGGGGLLFTDSNVARIYRKKIEKALGGVPVFCMEAGEAHKDERTLFALLAAMKEGNLRRNSVLIALGGGVVGDLGGLAASLYMRGISVIQIPTTLLAQVDSSVGGKTAIDFCGVKNLVGSFHQPEAVYADPSFFRTLPEREIRCGLGEIVKHGALCGEIFDRLEANRGRLFDLGFLAEIVPENIAFKADVVKKDPYERGLRRTLNLGHTTAHAIEPAHPELSHGECVLVGLAYEAEIAKKYCGADENYLDKLTGLAEEVLGISPWEVDAASCAERALLDKKNEGKSVRLVLPVARGRCTELELPFEKYRAELANGGGKC